MKNKTAVEWLIENLRYIPFDKTIFQQALEMEKQQIMNAKEEGYNFAASEAIKEIQKNYSETFKK